MAVRGQLQTAGAAAAAGLLLCAKCFRGGGLIELDEFVGFTRTDPKALITLIKTLHLGNGRWCECAALRRCFLAVGMSARPPQ